MSKYSALWEHIQRTGAEVLTFQEIGTIAGVPMDHSFLRYKKELLDYGYFVEKISRKEQAVWFQKSQI